MTCYTYEELETLDWMDNEFGDIVWFDITNGQKVSRPCNHGESCPMNNETEQPSFCSLYTVDVSFNQPIETQFILEE